MRLFIILAAVSLASAAKLDKTYLPPNAQASAGSNFLETPFSGPSGRRQNVFSNDQVNFGSNPNYGKPERAQAALERNAAILRQYNQNDGDNFSYAFETENGIFAEENGVATNGVEAQGSYSYTGDDGQVYSIRYTANQNGFVAQGDHLPTAPPVPEEILKALEQNARDEAAGVYDDGSYNEAKYGDNTNQYGNNYNGNYNVNRFNANANNGNNGVSAVDSDDTVVTNSALFPESRTAFRSQNGPNGLKAYLPPVRGPAGRTTVARRPSYNARDGYRY